MGAAGEAGFREQTRSKTQKEKEKPQVQACCRLWTVPARPVAVPLWPEASQPKGHLCGPHGGVRAALWRWRCAQLLTRLMLSMLVTWDLGAVAAPDCVACGGSYAPSLLRPSGVHLGQRAQVRPPAGHYSLVARLCLSPGSGLGVVGWLAGPGAAPWWVHSRGGGSGTRWAISHSPVQDRSRGGAGLALKPGQRRGFGGWSHGSLCLAFCAGRSCRWGCSQALCSGQGAPGLVGAAPACFEPTAQLMEQERRGWGEL